MDKKKILEECMVEARELANPYMQNKSKDIDDLTKEIWNLGLLLFEWRLIGTDKNGD